MFEVDVASLVVVVVVVAYEKVGRVNVEVAR